MFPKRGGLLERVSREEWNLGVIPQTAADIINNGIRSVVWLDPMHPWYGLADPAFVTTPSGTRVVFAERTNYWNGRGEIWMARLAPDEHLTMAKFQPWGIADVHLSYPFPIQSGRNLYFIMETGESGALFIWRQDLRRNTWIQTKLLDRPAIDPTIWRSSDLWWLFCTFADDEPDKKLHIFYASRLEGPWMPHPANPVKADLASSRPAGPLFYADERLIRPSQDCTQSYGSAVVLNVITELTTTAFHEQPLRKLLPLDEYPNGLHTLCPAGDWTIIDGKRWNFHPLDPLRYVIAGTRKHWRLFRSGELDLMFGDDRLA